jgi:hypothetical protein
MDSYVFQGSYIELMMFEKGKFCDEIPFKNIIFKFWMNLENHVNWNKVCMEICVGQKVATFPC